MPELISRIRALIRRPPVLRGGETLRFAIWSWTFAMPTFGVKAEQTLSRKEMRCSNSSLSTRSRALSAELLNRGWGGD
jgi:hypothetical protein